MAQGFNQSLGISWILKLWIGFERINLSFTTPAHKHLPLSVIQFIVRSSLGLGNCTGWFLRRSSLFECALDIFRPWKFRFVRVWCRSRPCWRRPAWSLRGIITSISRLTRFVYQALWGRLGSCSSKTFEPFSERLV